MKHAAPFSTFNDLENHLEARGFFRIDPGLERIERALRQKGLQRPPFFVIQVLGTNGKGSTSTFLDSLLRAAGFSCGLYTSPHFVSIRERVRVNGRLADETTWTRLGNEVFAACPELTYFEFTTALAVLAFAEAGVDCAVMEAGLGGSWDATTALASDLTLYAPIDIDHSAILGDTVALIARDKAGAIRPGVPVISAPQQTEALGELRSAAKERRAPLSLCGGLETLPPAIREERLPLLLGGGHQYGNAALALAAWRHIAATRNMPENPEREAAALARAFIPGRFQALPADPGKNLPAMLLDGGHNPHGLAALGRMLAEQGIAPAAVIFSCLGDKDISHILPHLRVLATGPLFIPPIEGNPRALPPAELARHIGLNAEPVVSLREALDRAATIARERVPVEAAHKHPVLLCGSLYLLGHFFSLYPEYLEPRLSCESHKERS